MTQNPVPLPAGAVEADVWEDAPSRRTMFSEGRRVPNTDATVWCIATQFEDGTISRGDEDIAPPTVHLEGTYAGFSPAQARKLAHEICAAAALAARWLGEIQAATYTALKDKNRLNKRPTTWVVPLSGLCRVDLSHQT